MIEIQALTKAYGERVVLDQISLSVPRGAIFGLVGPRGAGKGTLLRILATLIQPTSGDAFVGGVSVSRDSLRARQMVGYLPREFGVYPDQTCAEYIEFFAACYGVPPGERHRLAEDLLQLVDLYHRKDAPADRLTRAMRQRLGIARVLAHDPQVLLLDQLTAGLDPRARVELRELARELSAMGKTLVISASSLAEIQDICTHVAVMQSGRITQAGAFDDVAQSTPTYRIITVRFLGDAKLATQLLTAGRGVVQVQPHSEPAAAPEALAGVSLLKELRVTFDGTYAEASALLRSLMHSGVQVVSFAQEE